MATAYIEPAMTLFEGLSLPERDALDRFFAVKDQSLNFMPHMRRLIARGIVDGCEHLFEKKDNLLPTGLMKKAIGVVPGLTIIDRRMVGLEEAWGRAKKDVLTATLAGITPREEQRAAARAMVEQCRGVVTIATNGGKTPTGALAIKALGLNTLWLVESKDLLHQTASELEAYIGVPVGKIGDGIKRPGNSITVAMAQSLRTKKKDCQKFLEQFNVVVFDEAQHLSNGRQQAIGRCLINAPFRYAMTGSLPKDKLKTLKIMGMTDCINLYNITNKELIDAGHSASPLVHLHTVNHKNITEYRLVTKDGDTFSEKIPYKEMYETVVAFNDDYDQIVAKEAGFWVQEKGLSTFVTVDRVDHGKRLAKLINDLGVKCEFLWGDHSGMYRADKVRDFKIGLLPCIVTNIFKEGVNVPRIQALILAGAGKSSVLLLQRIGRALRRKEGMSENVAHIIDFQHKGEKYSNKHSKERLQIFHEEKFDIEEGKTYEI